MYRLRTGFKHLLLRTETRTDPITRALSVLIVAKSHVEYVDPKVLSQYLSLLFIGGDPAQVQSSLPIP